MSDYKRHYIHTGAPNIKQLHQEAIFNRTGTSLISLINGLKNTNFGYDSLYKISRSIRNFKNKYLQNSQLFIDSGGYSVIVGDVAPIDVKKFINCYNYYLEHERETYDRMLSLDIPIFLKYPNYNTKQHIYDFNKLSLTESIKILEKYPEIQKKWQFVWQFKIQSQYDIWKRLWEELQLRDYVQNYSIGGMVGLIGLCQLNFSPFIGPSFKCFDEYVKSGRFDHPFNLHLLGVYHKPSRFTMMFLNELFDHYLKEYNTECLITYDTVNYFVTSQYRARDQLQFFDYDSSNCEMTELTSMSDIPERLLQEVYTSDSLMQHWNENVALIKNKAKLKDVNFAVPLYVDSQIKLDQFFKDFIRKFQLIEIFVSSKDFNQLRSRLNPLLQIPQKYSFLTSQFTKQMLENMRICFAFHYWYTKKRDSETLEMMMSRFISKINFPGDLD